MNENLVGIIGMIMIAMYILRKAGFDLYQILRGYITHTYQPKKYQTGKLFLQTTRSIEMRRFIYSGIILAFPMWIFIIFSIAFKLDYPFQAAFPVYSISAIVLHMVFAFIIVPIKFSILEKQMNPDRAVYIYGFMSVAKFLHDNGHNALARSYIQRARDLYDSCTYVIMEFRYLDSLIDDHERQIENTRQADYDFQMHQLTQSIN